MDKQITVQAEAYADSIERRGCSYWNGLKKGYEDALAKLPKDLKGKYVSRAAFAKMQAEKQRLEKDIYIMVMGNYVDEMRIRNKYHKQFELSNMLSDALREAAKKEIGK